MRTVQLAMVLALAASPALSQSVVPDGRLLASNCFQCHGTNGRGPGFDELTGESAAELFDKLKEFQSGDKARTLMGHHALGYSDAQLLALARWFARQR